jgi:xylan 1,4-beta-xylosidase
MPTELFNPLIAGFNPDPSVVRVGDDYYVVTSSFEYLPGLPIYHSTDFEQWEQVGNVATRAEQLEIFHVPTPFGVFAPTIRHRDGMFYVIVTVVGGRGCVVFTAADPTGDWSDGTVIADLDGIDPDLAWGDDGTAYVTYSGHRTDEDGARRPSIMQVSVDLATGTILDQPRPLWSGTGLKFPEAPHLYQRGDTWYLLIAEGGTERGHAVSIARSSSPEGPFEGGPANPFLSARSTNRPIQNTGHGDIVELPDGTIGMVLLGMRPLGLGQAFSLLGRETFATRLEWVDGWPLAEPVTLNPRQGDVIFRDDFDGEALDSGWMAVRRTPADVAAVTSSGLILTADGDDLNGLHPVLLCRRQHNIAAEAAIAIDVAGGTGGLTIRYDENHHLDLEATGTEEGTHVVARLQLAGVQQEWHARLSTGPVILTIRTTPNTAQARLADPVERITLTAAPVADPADIQTIAHLDGRYLSAEVVVAFTGRVIGPYCSSGSVTIRSFAYRGTDA